MPQTIPPARYNAASAYDAARREVVIFGGCCLPKDLDDTWIWDGTTWAERHPAASPPRREAHVMAYDAARDEVVLFGGLQCPGFDPCTALGDTWTWDGTTWTERHPTASPPARFFAAMTYDAASGEMVLYGGNTGEPPMLNDTWVWDGSNWTERRPVTSPLGGRSAHTMAYDDARREVVVFGGLACPPDGVCSNPQDTWTWDGTTWSERSVAAAPKPRVQATMAYDADRSKVLLFGGTGGGGRLDDTWVWDGKAWLEQQPAARPPGRAGASAAYDAARREVVLFAGLKSGTVDDTWRWDGADWNPVVRTWPLARHSHVMAYDSARGETVLFGGQRAGDLAVMADTWVWDGTRWTQRHPADSPPPRAEASIAYDAARGEIVVFGGRDGGTASLGDTWTWDGGNWTEQHPLTPPPARRVAAMADHTTTERVLLFGGMSRGVPFGDTWTWDGSNWTLGPLIGAPPARQQAGMGEHAATGDLVLYGGYGACLASCALQDTWTWDGAGWTERHPPASPPARVGAQLAQGRATAQLLLFGGATCSSKDGIRTGCSPVGDTWTWDGSTWSELDAGTEPGSPTHFPVPGPGRPSPRLFSATAQGPDGQVMLFGGSDFNHRNDMWTCCDPPGEETEEPVPGTGEEPDGEEPDGEEPDGEEPDGEEPEGDAGPGDDGAEAPGTDRLDTVRRVAGQDRVATAIALSAAAFDRSDRAVLARADDFPDALAAGTLGVEVDGPVLLTGFDGLDPAVARELDRLGVGEVYLAGGVHALSPRVEEDLAAAGMRVTRLDGATRFETAAAVARAVVALGGPVTSAIVARADVFADALAAGSLATTARAPILLTATDQVPAATAEALRSLVGNGRVYLAGGTAAVGTEPERQLRADAYQVTRVSGPTRYDTAAALVTEALALGADPEPTVLASGANWPDALAAVPAAHRLGGVVTLVAPTDVDESPAMATFLSSHAEAIDTVLVAGGPEAVSDRVADQALALVRDP